MATDVQGLQGQMPIPVSRHDLLMDWCNGCTDRFPKIKRVLYKGPSLQRACAQCWYEGTVQTAQAPDTEDTAGASDGSPKGPLKIKAEPITLQEAALSVGESVWSAPDDGDSNMLAVYASLVSVFIHGLGQAKRKQSDLNIALTIFLTKQLSMTAHAQRIGVRTVFPGKGHVVCCDSVRGGTTWLAGSWGIAYAPQIKHSNAFVMKQGCYLHCVGDQSRWHGDVAQLLASDRSSQPAVSSFLIMACLADDMVTVTRIVEHPKYDRTEAATFRSKLIAAIVNGDRGTFLKLVANDKEKLSLEPCGLDCGTFLDLCIANGRYSMAEALLQRGAPVSASAIAEASEAPESLPCLQTLLDHLRVQCQGDRQDIERTINGHSDICWIDSTPLMYAFLSLNRKGVKLLLEFGADPNLTTTSGGSVWERAQRDCLTAEASLASDADVAEDDKLYTKGEAAIVLEMVQMFKDHGCATAPTNPTE